VAYRLYKYGNVKPKPLLQYIFVYAPVCSTIFDDPRMFPMVRMPAPTLYDDARSADKAICKTVILLKQCSSGGDRFDKYTLFP
jgi:hypothetical protein